MHVSEIEKKKKNVVDDFNVERVFSFDFIYEASRV